MTLPNRVRLIEVGPRDGLQNEKQMIPTPVKIELIHRLQKAGCSSIEITSFVSPKWIPQMADNVQMMAGINRLKNIDYSVLIPNLQGLNTVLNLPIHQQPNEIVVFGATSETFSQKNINCSIVQSMERFAPVVQAARAQNWRVRGALSCAVACPYEGDIAPQKVKQIAQHMLDIGVEQISVADTIGVGTPIKIQKALEAVLEVYPLESVSGHFHDTYGQALSNTFAALQMGISQFDTSIAGLGGCPYAQGATGNVATEDVVYLLNGLGIETGLDLDQLVLAGAFINHYLGRASCSRVGTARLKQLQFQSSEAN